MIGAAEPKLPNPLCGLGSFLVFHETSMDGVERYETYRLRQTSIPLRCIGATSTSITDGRSAFPQTHAARLLDRGQALLVRFQFLGCTGDHL
jgi:hypothetical protein